MTEQEWLTCTDPQALLFFLYHSPAAYVLISRYPQAYDRKHRLFGCFCCRRFWHLLRSKTSQRAVEVAERLAEGLVTEDERKRAYKNAQTGKSYWRIVRLEQEARANGNDDLSDRLVMAFRAAGALVGPYTPYGELVSQIAMRAASTPDDERALHCAWLRDLFGPLLFRPIEVDRSWLAWNDNTIPKLSQAIYDDRAFDRLPILADALEEAGCTNADILNHCRQPGEHVRGCWVVDLLLGKS